MVVLIQQEFLEVSHPVLINEIIKVHPVLPVDQGRKRWHVDPGFSRQLLEGEPMSEIRFLDIHEFLNMVFLQHGPV